jgi:flagellar protein FlgJ
MSTDAIAGKAYTDVQGLSDLKRAARAQDPAAVRETARQFESIFIRMMLQSMRDAGGQDELFSSQEGNTYRTMFDDQIALEMSRGKGIGIADMLVEQLIRAGVDAQASGVTQLSNAVIARQPAEGLAAPIVAPKPDSAEPAASAGATVSMAPMAAIGSPAAALSADTTSEAAAPASRRAFLESILPAAQKAADVLGVSPRSLMAQAALETGWGRSMQREGAGMNFNLFGIKASGSWAGRVQDQSTVEYVNGMPQRQVERFRAYDSIEASFADHARLLSRSPRYADAVGTGNDTVAYAQALQRGGYATDPAYARKLTAVAETIDRLMAARTDRSGV